jgi:hypothetical protein
VSSAAQLDSTSLGEQLDFPPRWDSIHGFRPIAK